MLTQSIGTCVIAPKVSPAALPTHDHFHIIAGQAGLVATEFSYKKDEEIYGEDEPSDYVYQVIRGSVRSYKLLSDGRRQIGAFYLPGDVFGLEFGAGTPPHRGSHRGHDRALGEAAEPRAGGRYHRRSGPQPLVDDRWRTSARRGSYAAPWPQERHRTRRQFSSGDGPPPGRNGHDGAPDVPQGYWRLSGVDP